MSLFDFFFPEQAQAYHLRRMVTQNALNASRERRLRSAALSAETGRQEMAAELQSLREDVGYLALVLAALGHRLDQKGIITRADLRAAAEEIDGSDSVKDGKLDIQVIKDALRGGAS